MNENRPPSLVAQRIVAAAVALLFGIGTLFASIDVPRSQWFIPMSPFGWHRLIVVYAVAALPLAWLIGSLTPNRFVFAVPAIALAVAGVLLSAWFGPEIGRFLHRCQSGFLVRHLIRIAWCVALEAPWFAAAAASFDKERVSVNAGILALVVGLLPAAFYAHVLCQTRTEAATEFWRKWRVVRAREEVWRLVDVGSGFPLGEEEDGSGGVVDVSALTALGRLDKNYENLWLEINRLQALPSPTKESRLLLADHLVALDAWHYAKRAIGELAEEDVTAALRVAQILQREEAWEESSTAFLGAIKLAPTAGDDAPSLKAYIYDSLAFNARELNRPEAAEAWYCRGLEELPEYTAHFHNQLGRHFELLGRVYEAEEHFRIAHETDPKRFPRSEGLLHRILSNGTPVGIFAPEASNYK